MKLTVRLNNEKKQLDIDFGIKIGHSLYVLCGFDSPHDKEDIIDFFMESTLEKAVKRAVLTDFFKENEYINLITGDGQVCKITIDVVN